MSESDSIVQTRAWWDRRASTVGPLPEVVGVGAYPLRPRTQAFLDGRVQSLLARATNKKTCLDAGCGVGLALPMLTEQFQNVIGIDFSEAVLNRIPSASREDPRITLKSGSVTDLPLEDGSVDAVFCRDVLQCLSLEAVVEALSEFRRVLSSHGVAVVHFKNSHHLMSRISRLRGNVQEDRDSAFVAGDVYLRPWTWYYERAKDQGFEVVDSFAWQLFFWGRLRRYHAARLGEILEVAARRTPLVSSVIRRDGIHHYVVLRKKTP
jgi:SAM-dependent methyltransferase